MSDDSECESSVAPKRRRLQKKYIDDSDESGGEGFKPASESESVRTLPSWCTR